MSAIHTEGQGIIESMLTLRCQKKDFKHNLPMKLLIGLSSLFTSIAAMLISKIRCKMRHFQSPLCLPIRLYALVQLPLYVDLWWSITRKVPLIALRLISTSSGKELLNIFLSTSASGYFSI